VHLGLFRWIEQGAEVRNLGVIDAYIKGGEPQGVLAGRNEGRVLNCYSSGTVTGTCSGGGLVGWNSGTIADSYSTAVVTGGSRIGGLVGDNWGTLRL
jgi:hypothetical protein